jgi:hypothetical protein
LARPHITGFRFYRGRNWILSFEPVINFSLRREAAVVLSCRKAEQVPEGLRTRRATWLPARCRLFDGPRRREAAWCGHHTALDCWGSDIARLVLHDDGRVRILGPAIRSEIIEHPACNFDRPSVIPQWRALPVPDFLLIRIDHGEELARDAPSRCPKRKEPRQRCLPRPELLRRTP